MKLSVSLSDGDLRLLDRVVQEAGLRSRSAGIQMALRNLADTELQNAYADAWREWEEDVDTEKWDAVTSDGLESN